MHEISFDDYDNGQMAVIATGSHVMLAAYAIAWDSKCYAFRWAGTADSVALDVI